MASLTDVVDLIHPAVSGVNILTTDTAWVLFDREIDESTVSDGNFFVTGPENDFWTGPDTIVYQPSDADEFDILESPGYAGLVQGTVSFARIDLTDSSVEISGIDTVGSGHLYRTKAIFTPDEPFAPNTQYQIYLAGDNDPTDSTVAGISERTVFDPLASGTNTGSGDIEADGGYTGLNLTDVYHVNISTGGDVDNARFTFYRDRDPSSIFGPFKTRRGGVLLSDGVTVSFNDGIYTSGDSWLVRVKASSTLSGLMTWPFTTDAGSILAIPSTTSTSVVGDTISSTSSTTSTSSSTFSVSSTSPTDGATNRPITIPFNITATFSNDIDATTVISGVDVVIYTEAVTGDPSVPASGYIAFEPTVADNVLTLSIPRYQLYANNLVTVTLDSTIADTDGTALGEDYEWEFTTTYDPLYCTVRRLRLEIGQFIVNVPDDTLNLAIHLASLEADSMTFNTDTEDDAYYQFVRSQWACCRAQEMLLLNTVGASGALKSKKLGDLSVEYDTSSGGSMRIALERAVACQEKWEQLLQQGGRTIQTPVISVKGEWDVDRPSIGRGWAHTRDIYNPSVPASNRRVRYTDSRRYRSIYTRLTTGRKWWNE